MNIFIKGKVGIYSFHRAKILNILILIWSHFWIPVCVVLLYNSIDNHNVFNIWVNSIAIFIHCAALFFGYLARNYLVTQEIHEITSYFLLNKAEKIENMLNDIQDRINR